ncbi:MAG: glycosyltransferase [Holophagales bacterium]|nr:glycosyltransferase [Holophagales bacterium]
MRILQLCPKVPWPPDDGGRVAMRVLALSLQKAGADVRVLSMNPAKHRVDPRSLPDEARDLRLEAIDVDTPVTVGGALSSLVRGTSYNVDRFRSKAFERRLREVAGGQAPDVVLLESLFMAPYVPALRDATTARVVLRSVNLEHEIWEGLARGERRIARRLYLRHLARQLRRFEVATMNDVDAIVAVTPEDARTYARLGATVPLHVAPVGIGAGDYPDRSGQGDPWTLVFLGSLDWRPNLEAAEWFLGSVWPLVKRAVPQARFHVGGSNPPEGLAARLSSDGVRFLGRVPDARGFLSSGSAMVVPLLSGGGMRVKILEAMALGVPVASTRLGASGIGAEAGTEILLADGPEGLAAACASLLLDRDRSVGIGQAGRRRAHESFDADGIGGRLLEFLETVGEHRAPVTTHFRSTRGIQKGP